MARKEHTTTIASDGEIGRTVDHVAEMLRKQRVRVTKTDSATDIANILEAVEEFEDAVKLGGGDLMVDEPPDGGEPQPDDPRFILPERRTDESAEEYLGRLDRATDLARRKPAE